MAIGIDCDPDRDAYPARLAWRGIEQLTRLFDIPDVKWTFNIRADTQVRDYCGSAGYCREQYRQVWDAALRHGSALAWHLHYFDRNGKQDTSEANIAENVRLGAEALGHPETIHMGWTFQNDFSIGLLYEAGVRVDYSPVPRMRFNGHHGVHQFDWSEFSYRPQLWHGVRMVPAYTFPHRLLSRRFGTERVMLTTTTAPLLYRALLREFFRTGSDFFVSYFHADEIAGAVGGWRDRLYGYGNLVTNLRRLRSMAERQGYRVTFMTIPELAAVLFDGRRPRHS